VLEEFPIFEILQRDLSQRRDDLDDPVIRSRRFQHRHPSLELKLVNEDMQPCHIDLVIDEFQR